MNDKTLSVLSIIIGIVFLAFVKWNKTGLTEGQKSRRATTIVVGFLWIFGGIFLLTTKPTTN